MAQKSRTIGNAGTHRGNTGGTGKNGPEYTNFDKKFPKILSVLWSGPSNFDSKTATKMAQKSRNVGYTSNKGETQVTQEKRTHIRESRSESPRNPNRVISLTSEFRFRNNNENGPEIPKRWKHRQHGRNTGRAGKNGPITTNFATKRTKMEK